MLGLALALLDARRLIHLALAAMIVAAIHTFGSPEIRGEVDRLVVTPVSHAAEMVGRQLDYPLAAAHSAVRFLGRN